MECHVVECHLDTPLENTQALHRKQRTSEIGMSKETLMFGKETNERDPYICWKQTRKREKYGKHTGSTT